MNYNEAKVRQLDATGTYRVYGHSVEFDHGGDEGVARKRRHLVNPCLCVQDSPQNPCPCDRAMLWWLSGDAVVAQGNSGRKDDRGQELQYFDVLVESTIMVESLQPVKAGALKALGTNLDIEHLRGLGVARDGSVVPGTMQDFVEDVIMAVGAALYIELFKGPSLQDIIEEWKKKHPPQPPK